MADISNRWQKKFDLLEKIGADRLFIYQVMATSEYKKLRFGEKQKITFNWLAFFFGPFYYFTKRMWLKGLVILGLGWVLITLLSLLEILVGVELPYVLFSIPVSVICAQLATYDYFRHVKRGERMWGGVPGVLSQPLGALGFAILALVAMLGVSALSPADAEVVSSATSAPDAEILEDMSGVWRFESDGTIITISLIRAAKSLEIRESSVPVTISAIDHDNDIVTIAVTLPKVGQVHWAIRKIAADDDGFNLLITLHDGTRDVLSFVRNLEAMRPAAAPVPSGFRAERQQITQSAETGGAGGVVPPTVLINNIVPGKYEAEGRSEDDSADLTISHESGNLYKIEGLAFWKDNIGIVDYYFRLENGRAKMGDEYCTIQLEAHEGYLLIDDNVRCGGMNVTFKGRYSPIQ